MRLFSASCGLVARLMPSRAPTCSPRMVNSLALPSRLEISRQSPTCSIVMARSATGVSSDEAYIQPHALKKSLGFSYGTTLGATLVSMFPDEVDRVVLDGVQNPHEYYNAYA